MSKQTLQYYPRFEIDTMPSVFLRVARTVGLVLLSLLLLAVLSPMLAAGWFLLIAASYSVYVARRTRVQRIIWYCQQAVSANLPIGPMLAAAAADESPFMRRRLVRTFAQLNAGRSLAMALERSVPELSRDIVATISAAERTGRLPHALDRLWSEIKSRGGSREQTVAVMQAYAIYGLIAVWMLSSIMIVVIPRFEVILHDFHSEPPWAMKTAIWLAASGPLRSLFESDFFAPFACVASVIFVWALLIGPLLAGLFSWRRWVNWEAWTDPIAWHIPVWGAFVRDRGLSRIFDFASDAVTSGYGLDRALTEVAPGAGNGVLSRRIGKWADGIAAGKSIEQAARAAHLPSQVAAFLAPAHSDDDLAAALKFLSAHYDYRAARADAIFKALLIPLFVTLIGSIVALLGLSLFQTMALITNAVAPTKLLGGM